MGWHALDLFGSVQGHADGSCERGNECVNQYECTVANEDTGSWNPNQGVWGEATIPRIYKVMCKCSGIRKACREISSVSIKLSKMFFDMAETKDLLTYSFTTR